MAKGETMMASKLGVKVVDTINAKEVVNSNVRVVDPIETIAELVNSLIWADVVNFTTDVVNPTTVKIKLVDNFIDDEVVNT